MDNLITEYVEVKVDKESNVLAVYFKKFVPFPDFKKTLEYEYELIKHYNLKKAFIDLRYMTVYDTGATDYVKDVWFPTVTDLGLKFVAFVQPEAVLGQMAMKKAHKEEEEKAAIEMKHVGDPEAAKQWLESCR